MDDADTRRMSGPFDVRACVSRLGTSAAPHTHTPDAVINYVDIYESVPSLA